VRSKSEKSDELLAVLAEIIPAARTTEGVINFDIARTPDDPDSFIATVVYDDGAALERQESAPEVQTAMANLYGVAGGTARANDLRRIDQSRARLGSATDPISQATRTS
jgi:quinol monooxygenase YgiN